MLGMAHAELCAQILHTQHWHTSSPSFDSPQKMTIARSPLLCVSVLCAALLCIPLYMLSCTHAFMCACVCRSHGTQGRTR
jgi:hypothetical protein